MQKIKFTYIIILLFTILLLAAYWIFDSFWSVTVYKANLRYLIHNPPLSLMDTLSFKVPPYQATARIVVSLIIILMGVGALIINYVKERINCQIRKDEEERIRLMEIVQRAKRMDTVELMAGGVAHDLNNILSGVTTYPETLLLNMDKNDPMFQPLATILEAGRQAANIVKDLSTLSKGAMPHDQVVNLNYLIQEFTSSQALLQKLPRDKHIRIIPSYSKEKIYIRGSETHIFKIIMNLTINAINSIDKKYGEVRITTSVVELSNPIEKYPDVRKGKYAILEVKDTGKGINEDDLDHIFEPFFTKNMLGINGSGTGLGLTIVWAAVHEHGGYIWVKSSPDGTTFRVYLPIEEKIFLEEGKAMLVKKFMGNGERILVVDDNKIQRQILQTLLTMLKYEVVTTNSGENALDLIKAGQKFDLIILDVSMPPGMSGCATFTEILKFSPNQKAIIASGYMDSSKVKSAMDLGIRYFIHKPYSIQDISEKIYNTLTSDE
jgi:signal transduction histidine kinase/ActR/RegA family two-component response regulator